MSEEYLKSIIDCVSGIECKHETQQIAKYELIEHIEELRKENQSLKDRIENGIEYIKERTEFNQYSEVYPSVLDAREVKRLLEILKRDK